MSVDREYTIRISTMADASGTEQASRGLRELGRASEEAGEDAELLTLRGRELHELIIEMARVAPNTGSALKALLDPAGPGLAKRLRGFDLHQEAAESNATMGTMETTPKLKAQPEADKTLSNQPLTEEKGPGDGEASEILATPGAFNDPGKPAANDNARDRFGAADVSWNNSLSQQESRQLASLRALFEAVAGNSVAVIELAKQSLALHLSHDREITNLKAQFDNLSSRMGMPRQ